MATKPIFEPNELMILKQSIEQITIKGKDAPMVAAVLTKLDKELQKSLPEQ